MEILTYFTTILALALFAAMLEMAFQFFMYPNMFFYPWAVALLKLSQKNEILRHLTRVLGRCRYCNGTWIGIYAYLYYYPFDIRILFMIGATFFFIMFLTIYIFPNVDTLGKVEPLFQVNSDRQDPTPVPAMLKTYLIMALFYSMVYIVIPKVIDVL